MEKDQIFILKDRGVIYISGENAKDFLQNIVTNDINKVTDNSSCFASLLTPQGKYLFDFIVVKHKQGYFLDCEKNLIDGLIDKLNIYKLNSKIEILNLSNEFEVAVISREKFLELEGSQDIEGNTIKYNNDPIVLDPRSKYLGGRLIVNLEKLTLSLKKLSLNSEDPQKYYNLSHKLGIPQINTKSLQNKIFGLECNFEELNGIDFKKGCYIGQENTSRIKMRNKLSKRIFAIESEKNLKEDNEMLLQEKVVGKILISKPKTFALIKINEPGLNVLTIKDLKCNGFKVNLIKPDWLK
tara:strand:+ start:243 stop:1133 length:891 start_codon:yes stop_codon:yes gene_type:complete